MTTPKKTKGRNSPAKPPKKPAQQRSDKIVAMTDLRDEIALRVLQGLYSNIADAQKFVGSIYPGVSLAEALTRTAYEQADEALRLRAL